MSTSDRILDTERTIANSETTAAKVLVDLESQRNKLHNVHGLVKETTGFTIATQMELKRIAATAARKKRNLYLIIVTLVIIDLWVFYELFINRR